MIVSHRSRFVMLTPWKTASQTTYHRLESHDESPYNRFYDYNPHLQRVVHQHLTYADFRALPEARLGYFTAVFVRNPYDRVYSGFLQLQRDIANQPASEFPSSCVKSLVLRQLADNFAQLAAGEFEFDKWWRLVEDHQIYVAGRNTSFPLHPAFYWTGIEGQQLVNFVGKVEAFEDDFDAFCARAKIDPPIDRVNANITSDLPQKAERPRYADRMSAYSRSKVEALFEADFDLFGYQKFTG